MGEMNTISRRNVLKSMGATATIGLGSTPATAKQGGGPYYDVGSAALSDYYEGLETRYKGEESNPSPGGLEGDCGRGKGSSAIGYVFRFDELGHQTLFQRDANLPAPIPDQHYIIQNVEICDANIFGPGTDAHLHRFNFRPTDRGRGNHGR